MFEIIGGVVLLTSRRCCGRSASCSSSASCPRSSTDGRSSAILGATITAVELPTAFPYFAAIAAVVGSGYGVWHQVFLILIFNVAFVLPLLAIIAILTFAGSKRPADARRRPELAGAALAGHARRGRPDRGTVLRVHRDHRAGRPASLARGLRRPPAAPDRRPLSRAPACAERSAAGGGSRASRSS